MPIPLYGNPYRDIGLVGSMVTPAPPDEAGGLSTRQAPRHRVADGSQEATGHAHEELPGTGGQVAGSWPRP